MEQGKTLGSVESVKAVSDIYSPVSGEVVEINALLADAPEKLNEDPHGAAWLVKIKLSAARTKLSNSHVPPPTIKSYIGAEIAPALRYLPKSDFRAPARCWTPVASEPWRTCSPTCRRRRCCTGRSTLPPGMSEYEIVDYFRARRRENANGYASFLGAGVYAHYRPVLCDVVVSRGEFLTSYTPYQAEIAQGTLTTIFEFQTMVCQLTGMEVANASMYDGSTAVPEAAMMAMPHHRARHACLVCAQRASGVPARCSTTRSTQGHAGRGRSATTRRPARSTWPIWKRSSTTRRPCVIIQSPNFFGVVEQMSKAAAESRTCKGALLVYVFTEAVSLGLLEPPREADIVAGELQSLRHLAQLRRAVRRASSRRRRSTSGRSRAGWWARPRTPTAIAPSA